jgi:hypothetical protein
MLAMLANGMKNYCVQLFLVKQRCLSEDFIAINDKRKRLPWVFMSDEGGEKKT